MELPTSINIRSPLSIRRCAELIQDGKARNFSEAADNLILIGSAHEGSRETSAPASQREDGKEQTEPSVAR